MPPPPLTAFKPNVPSVAVPERMMQMAFSPRSSAIDLKKQSMGRLILPVFTGVINWSVPFIMITFLSGGLRYTRFGSSFIPSFISLTSIWVHFDRREPIMLLCLGLRCWITTKAMLLSWGIWEKNVSSASSPPADAPMPTMWKSLVSFRPVMVFFAEAAALILFAGFLFTFASFLPVFLITFCLAISITLHPNKQNKKDPGTITRARAFHRC